MNIYLFKVFSNLFTFNNFNIDSKYYHKKLPSLFYEVQNYSDVLVYFHLLWPVQLSVFVINCLNVYLSNCRYKTKNQLLMPISTPHYKIKKKAFKFYLK